MTNINYTKYILGIIFLVPFIFLSYYYINFMYKFIKTKTKEGFNSRSNIISPDRFLDFSNTGGYNEQTNVSKRLCGVRNKDKCSKMNQKKCEKKRKNILEKEEKERDRFFNDKLMLNNFLPDMCSNDEICTTGCTKPSIDLIRNNIFLNEDGTVGTTDINRCKWYDDQKTGNKYAICQYSCDKDIKNSKCEFDECCLGCGVVKFIADSSGNITGEQKIKWTKNDQKFHNLENDKHFKFNMNDGGIKNPNGDIIVNITGNKFVEKLYDNGLKEPKAYQVTHPASGMSQYRRNSKYYKNNLGTAFSYMNSIDNKKNNDVFNSPCRPSVTGLFTDCGPTPSNHRCFSQYRKK